MLLKLIIWVGLICSAYAAGGGVTWSYNNQNGDGPSAWAGLSPKCGAGTNPRQSPVNIDDGLVDFDPNLYLETTPSFSGDYTVTFTNTNKTVKITFADDIVTRARVQGVIVDYKLDSAHFHWGTAVQAGSEHTLDGVQFSGEIHFVHYRTIYSGLGEALAAGSDSLLVIGVFLQHANSDFPAPNVENGEMKRILAQFSTIRAPDASTTLTVNPGKLLPSSHLYYNYDGGLTTPSCDGVVQWYVFKQPLIFHYETINPAFFDVSQTPQGPSGVMGPNFRPVQGMGSRRFRRNHGVTIQPHLWVFLLAFIASVAGR